MTQTLATIISSFDASAKEKLKNPAATGAPEDQLRAQLEQLLKNLAALIKLSAVPVPARVFDHLRIDIF